MKYIEVNTNKIKPKQADWRENIFRLRDKVMDLAYVRENPHKETQAIEWLECLCKVHPYERANTFIEQASGLGSQEMRALTMHDQNKYFPSLSAIEIYRSKRLEAFPVRETSFDKNTNDAWIKSAVRDVLLEKTSGHRSIESENRMLRGNSWLKSRPSLFYSTARNNFITDIEINKGAKISPDSEMRLQYHSIVASSVAVGSESNILLRANLSIDNQQLNALKALASTSVACKHKAQELLVELIRDESSQTELDIGIVDYNEELVSSLITTGSEHWNKINTDLDIPLVKKDKPLPEDISEKYTHLSKELVVAQKIQKSAENYVKYKRSEIINMVNEEGLTENSQSPNDLTHLREGKVWDKKRLFADLVTLGVPKQSLMKREIDEDLLLSIYDKSGGQSVDISSAIKFKGTDIEKLKEAANEKGLELQEYQSTTLTPYLSVQTRGPVYEKIQEITQMIDARTSSTISSISTSKLLDHQDLTSSLKNTGVSKQIVTTTSQDF